MQFTPFFTLISTATSNHPSTGRATAAPEHHHPTVHYIFSDDDDDSYLITEAALLSLQSQDPTSDPDGLTTSASRSASRVLDRRKHHPHLTRVSTEDSSDADGDGEGEDPSSLSRMNTLQARQKGGRERYIVLDVVPNQPSPNTTLQGDTTTTSLNAPIAIGTPTTAHLDRPPHDPPFTISSAHSLDPDFAVLSTSLSPAPTFEHDADTPAPSQSGWMLNISGIMNTGPSSARNAEKVPAGVTVEALEDLAERFEREMGVLRSVMGRDLPNVDLGEVEGERILKHADEEEEHEEQLIADTEVGVGEAEGVADR
jgi:hypothetical protein